MILTLNLAIIGPRWIGRPPELALAPGAAIFGSHLFIEKFGAQITAGCVHRFYYLVPIAPLRPCPETRATGAVSGVDPDNAGCFAACSDKPHNDSVFRHDCSVISSGALPLWVAGDDFGPLPVPPVGVFSEHDRVHSLVRDGLHHCLRDLLSARRL